MRSLCAWRTEWDAVRAPVRLSTSHDLRQASDDVMTGRPTVSVLTKVLTSIDELSMQVRTDQM